MNDYEIVRAMQRFGGSFATALAAACERADTENLQRIKDAFPELWNEYRIMAELARQRQAASK